MCVPALCSPFFRGRETDRREFAWFTVDRSQGWPSFRDAEVVWENVRCLQNGEAVPNPYACRPIHNTASTITATDDGDICIPTRTPTARSRNHRGRGAERGGQL